MEAERQSFKCQRKRIKCDVCQGNILQGFFKMHRARCYLLTVLNQYSTKTMSSIKKKDETKKKQTESEDWPQGQKIEENQEENEYDFDKLKQKVQKAYQSLAIVTKQAKQEQKQKKRELYSTKNQKEAGQCHYCGQKTNHFRIHQQYCSTRHNFCQFCGQEVSRDFINSHHGVCLQKGKMKRIQMLMEDSSEQEQQQQWPGYREGNQDQTSFRPTHESERVQINEDDVYQANPFYRYRRQYLPTRNTMNQDDKELEKSVTQALIRYGYGQESIDRLREHPKFLHYLRLIDDFINEDNQNTFSQGMTQHEIEHLKQSTYREIKKEEKQEDICAICYSEFEDNEDIVHLTCDHYFHQFCIRKWLEINFRCPICKFPQVSRKIQIES